MRLQASLVDIFLFLQLERDNALLDETERLLAQSERQLSELERAHFVEVDAVAGERRSVRSRRERADVALRRCCGARLSGTCFLPFSTLHLSVL